MKRIALLTVLLCCMVSASAQHLKKESNTQKSWQETLQMVEKLNRHENLFTMKLDSVKNDFEKVVLNYDSRYNCTWFAIYYYDANEWWMGEGYEYVYDDQNLLVSMIDYDEEYREDYTYNAQNQLVQIEQTYLDEEQAYWRNTLTYDNENHVILSVYSWFRNNEWREETKRTYDYVNGLLVTETFYYYDFETNVWTPATMDEYAYNDGGLCVEKIYKTYSSNHVWLTQERTVYNYNGQSLCSEILKYSWGGGAWHEQSKNTYEYDSAGNLLLEISFYYSSSQGWVYDEKIEYAYDENNNCTFTGLYQYYMGSWDFRGSHDMTYNTTIDIGDIAGLTMFWEFMMDFIGINPPIYSQLQVINGTMGEWEPNPLNCYYSITDGINEQTDKKLTLWPNPATETLTLNADDLQQVEIYSMEGKIVTSQAKGFEAINVSQLTKGVYLLQAIFTDGTKAVQKFVKE